MYLTKILVKFKIKKEWPIESKSSAEYFTDPAPN